MNKRRVRAGKPVELDWPDVDDLPRNSSQRRWEWMDLFLFTLVFGLALAGFTKFVGLW